MTVIIASVYTALLFCVLCVPECYSSDDSFLPSGGVFRDDMLFDISWNGPPDTDTLITDRSSKSEGEGTDEGGRSEGEVGLFEEKGVNEEMDTGDEVMDRLLSEVDFQEVDYVDMRTGDDEEYRCVVPKIGSLEDKDDEKIVDEEAVAEELIRALHTRCTKLLMGYWMYELCHDKILRQYHEPMKQPNGEQSDEKLDEYILGRFSASQDKSASKYELEAETKPRKVTKELPVWYFNGNEYPYYEVKMDGGTLCDLKDKVPRSVTIKYICDINAHLSGTFLHIEEVTTCKYEAIVSTTSLCQNIAYRLKENPVHSLQCYSKDGSPSKPNSLLEHELSVMNKFLQGSKHQKPPTSKGAENKDEEKEDTEEEEEDMTEGSRHGDMTMRKDAVTSLGDDFVKSFLSGKMCLRGGAGWWQHEVCYGRYVKQIHEVIGKDPDEILLGEWLEEGHRRWFSNAKDRKQSSSHVVHLYMNGDVCDLTGVARQCQVKFRCSKSGSPSKITLFLEEPTSCNYMVTVEAAFLCPLLKDTDQYGMLHVTENEDEGEGVLNEEEENKEIEEELDEQGNVKKSESQNDEKYVSQR